MSRRDAYLKEMGLTPLWTKRGVVAQATPPASSEDRLLQGDHSRGYLPHLKAEGGIHFVTFRLADSLPVEVPAQWKELSQGERTRQTQAYLDAGHGECWLARPDVAAALKEVLLKYDGERYRLHAWAIMPNHVHLVIEPLDGFSLSKVLQGIKSASAHEANRLLEREGEFWQRESYDHLIRGDEDFARCCEYVRENPVSAGLAARAEDYGFSDVSERAGEVACATKAPVAQATPPASDSDDIAALDWEQLQAAVAACTRCPLHRSRTRGVFGVGDPNADWLVVGEAPGADEDAQGEPFVGQAGKLLDNMLKSIGLKRGDKVFIANVLKSRPPGNRNPEAEEVAACMPYLRRQIELIRPKIILVVGRFAAQALLGTDAGIGSLRGQVHRYQGIPVIVTYHPAYLLRSLTEKAKAWEDLCLARETFAGLEN